MGKLIGMVKKNNKDVTYMLIIAFVLVMLSMLLINRGTYSVDEVDNTDYLAINCPDSATVGGEVECSIDVNLVTMTAYGLNAKYNVPEEVEFVEFTSENWEIYSNETEGFVLVNLDGVVGNASVGTVKFIMPTTATANETYKIELTDISVGDGEEIVLNLDSVSDEVRIKSNINTLDNIPLTNATLNETFDKDKLEYTGMTSADKINIEVVKTDEYSVVSGDTGEKDVHYGTNTFSIVVTSEDGNVKTYTLKIYKEYKFSSDKYVYNEEENYLYVGDDEGLLANIDVPSELSKDIKDNKLIISYQEEVLKEIDLIIVSSDSYDLSNEYIYLMGEEFDISKITFVNCDDSLIDNKLVIKYGDIVIDEFDILSIDLGELSVTENVITLSDYLSISSFMDNITLNGKITSKIFNGDEEVTSGDISDGMTLRLYYNEEELDSYNIVVYDLSFDENLIIDEDNSYIKYKKVKSTVSEFLTNVDIVGDVRIFISDIDGNEKSEDDLIVTGDMLTIFVGSEKKDEYKIAVRGDANGDGKVSSSDLVHIRKHIVGWKNPNTGIIEKKSGIYLYAIDMNDDNKISSSDLVNVRKVIVGIDIDE